MKIIIMRHGQAEYSGQDRILTPRGLADTAAVARRLAQRYTLTRVLTSTKTRTRQTAEQVLRTMGRDLKPEVLGELTPNGNPALVRSYLDAAAGPGDTVLIVSHIPLVQELCYELTNHHEFGPEFATSSAQVLDYDGTLAIMEGYFTPGA